ncbi:hypothetical protein AHMF7605_19385 [Adhaeribacter arboris]|uniref:Uncharacterized protein n=1 Tax=Adhaeribacter arboris TaxID=2072846 RepID=A0A2T2YJ30_9BACT|nr:hypothetical protein [Adhaeribacter arboris]PSR55516.1 hypothetical protein AHMF7605_19385 [Adhaeribacter arboris]
MNLDNLKSGWQQYKVMHSLPAMEEEEILSIIEAKPRKASGLVFSRVTQNTLLYAFLLLCVNGGCAI